jgi:hypothetical protein
MRAVAERVSFDVLVVGSGASGLAAASSAERAGARVALVTKGSLQSCNSAKAQGGIQAAFGDDDSRAARRGRLAELARDGRPPARRGAHARGAGRDPLARGAGRRVHAREWRLPAGALRRRDPQAAAAGRRPHGAQRSRARLRDAYTASAGESFPNSPLVSLEQAGERLGRDLPPEERRRARDRRGRRSCSPPAGRCYREAEERGELSTNHPGSDRAR